MKYEWRKQEKTIYTTKKTPVLVDIPKQKFILIQGTGNPNEEAFSERISALYSVAYAIKMLFKATMKNQSDDNVISDYTVYPLEGIWEKGDSELFDKNELSYTLMIKQPDFITQEIFAEALDNVKRKKPNILYKEITFNEMEEGTVIQLLHVGSYDDEPKSFAKMDQLADSMNLTRTSRLHKEIYLSNKSKTAEDNQKTILRYSVN